ncbi:dihydrofolate reductase [Chloroflexia bacterium SDU3-3]|nr:dihydrofolate reductase [Chloroflexia bacterium SDU3-3]
MGQIIVTEFVSLDGVMENPAWTMPYWNDEVASFKRDETERTDSLLLGRVTYEAFAQAWPTSQDEGAPHMNSIPKFVASTTLRETTWNASVIEGDLLAGIASLRERHNMLVYGSATLVATLLRHQLVDELRLLVYPVVLGEGKRMFPEGVAASYRLDSVVHTSTGVVGLTYRPA